MNYSSAALLFASPRPLFGVARIIDFGGSFDEYNVSATEQEADAKAIVSDWQGVRVLFDGALKSIQTL
jgi:hypothetical protein